MEPEQQEEWLADFSAALQAAKDKRDRLNWFMCLMEACIVAGEAEKKRLDKRSARCTAALERLNLVVTRVIKERGQDADGRWIKLEGNNVTFKLANNPPSVAVTDEAAVPTEFKTVTVTLPAPLWEEVCDSLDLDLRDRVLESVKRPDSKVAKTAVKEAIAASIPNWKERLKEEPAVFCDEVPGASIKAGGTRLVRE